MSISDTGYGLPSVTVPKGATVRWTNNDSVLHTVTADSFSGPHSGALGNGQTYSFTFANAGTFTYHCLFHPSMQGSVIVTE